MSDIKKWVKNKELPSDGHASFIKFNQIKLDKEKREEQYKMPTKKEYIELMNKTAKDVQKIEKEYNIDRLLNHEWQTEGVQTQKYCSEERVPYIKYKKRSCLDRTLENFNNPLRIK